MELNENFYVALKKIISFRSVLSEEEPGMPFGRGVYEAYKFYMDLAESFGFKTVNYDNYIGEIVYGEGEEIGIIGHVDVVPEGNGWHSDPYVLTEKDGVFFGRGICDDKGPMLTVLYALKALKDSGKKCLKKFRLFVGCNEESGWRDAEYFTRNRKFPVYGFSPDGNFPLSYAEKGITVLKFYLPALKGFYGLKGGTVVNAVCGYASARIKGWEKMSVSAREEEKSKVKNFGLTLSSDGLIESVGKSAHGSKPELGVNALKPLFSYFRSKGENVDSVLDYLFDDKGGLKNLVNSQGKVTLSPDLAEEKDGEIIITCDCRIPAPLSEKDVLKIVDKFGMKYTATEKHPPVMVGKDTEFIKKLLEAYNSVTGENALPIAIGGSTFARVFEKGCAFGAEFPSENAFIHEPDERISKENLLKLYEIYKTALFLLSE